MHGILNISLDIIKSNWRNLNNASNGKAAAVIKANSYGLGMLQIAKSLIDAGCRYFYVANTEEAIILRKENPSKELGKAIEKSDDPIRMYLREMGGVELLSREGEIAIAKRI